MNQYNNKKRSRSAVAPLLRLPKIYPSNHTIKSVIKQASSKMLSNNSSSFPPKVAMKFKSRLITQPIDNPSRNETKKSRINHIAGPATKMLQDQIQQAAKMFQKIHILRQQHGVISYEMRDEQQKSFDQKIDVPYNPELHSMNEQICHIKRKIEEKMQNVFKIAKNYPKIRAIIEDTLDTSSKQALFQNEKVGKTGAMKAHKRLIHANQA